mgnify:FL=1|tara:strand:+ start:127 stop:1140 length:1014 start_codon:yes stop_codon:yes gene_type:complete
MTNQTMRIIDRVEKRDKYNILTFDTHERYQSQLSKTGHNFYSFRYDDCKVWDESYAKLPDNYYILPKNSITNGLNIDFILSQSKFGQFQVASRIREVLNIPILSLEHTLPIPDWPEQQLESFKSMAGDANVFISDYSVKRWNMNCPTTVIHHSVDSKMFTPTDTEKTVDVLSVVNEFPERDYCCNYGGWQRVVSKFQAEEKIVDVIGNGNEAISNIRGGVADGIEDLVSRYNGCKVFLNTSTISPVPTSLLEAMSCGCAVVSTATCMIPEIIENGVNGFISNDEEELKSYIDNLLNDEELRKKMGNAARETTLNDFSEESFINNWNNIFDDLYGVQK